MTLPADQQFFKAAEAAAILHISVDAIYNGFSAYDGDPATGIPYVKFGDSKRIARDVLERVARAGFVVRGLRKRGRPRIGITL